jgi:hypothetical protein
MSIQVVERCEHHDRFQPTHPPTTNATSPCSGCILESVSLRCVRDTNGLERITQPQQQSTMLGLLALKNRLESLASQPSHSLAPV